MGLGPVFAPPSGALPIAPSQAARTQLLAGEKVEREAGRLVRRQLARQRAAAGRSPTRHPSSPRRLHTLIAATVGGHRSADS